MPDSQSIPQMLLLHNNFNKDPSFQQIKNHRSKPNNNPDKKSQKFSQSDSLLQDLYRESSLSNRYGALELKPTKTHVKSAQILVSFPTKIRKEFTEISL